MWCAASDIEMASTHLNDHLVNRWAQSSPQRIKGHACPRPTALQAVFIRGRDARSVTSRSRWPCSECRCSCRGRAAATAELHLPAAFVAGAVVIIWQQVACAMVAADQGQQSILSVEVK